MPTFFDGLPGDLHEHIAKHLLPHRTPVWPHFYEGRFFEPRLVLGERYQSTLLNYAKVGEEQRRAVMKAMQNNLLPYDFSRRTLKDWVMTFRDSIYELNLENLSCITFESRFPDLPNLRKCSIRGVPDQLSAITGCPKLSDVTITVIRVSLWGDIVRALCSLPVTVLSFHVRIFGRMRKLDSLSTEELALLCQGCPNIKELELTGRVAMTTNLSTMISSFPILKKLRINCSINEQDIRCMQALEEVDLYKSHTIKIAVGLGKSLVGLALDIDPASTTDIEKLSACPNLRRLVINISENAVAALVGKIGNVEELCLVWGSTSLQQSQQTPAGLAFFELDGKVLQDVIRSAPKLMSLVIVRAVVKEEALQNIMEICGRRLVNIELHVDKQKVPVSVRVEAILKMASQYCFNLKSLWFLEDHRDKREKREVVTMAEMDGCFKALKALMKAAPEFTSYRRIELFLESMLV